MTQEELFDALQRLKAYYYGAEDDGIADPEALWQQLVTLLHSYDEATLNRVIATLVRERYLSDAAIAQGKGLEDAIEFLKWLTLDILVDDIWRLRW